MGELERDLLCDLDLDLGSPLPFSWGVMDLDLLRDFTDSSTDALRDGDPTSDWGLDLLSDLDFLVSDLERECPLLLDREWVRDLLWLLL